MNASNPWMETARLPIVRMQDVLLARWVGRDEATRMGFAPAILTRVATGISEITRNVVQHAGCSGEIRIGRIEEGDRSGLRIVVSDAGRGMDQAERFLEGEGLGTVNAGIAGARRLADHFDLQSAPAAGTVVTMEFWERNLPGD